MLRNDIICALATPAGMGAIAVIRLSGYGCILLVDKVFQSTTKTKKLKDQPTHTAHFGSIVLNGQVVDEVVATVFRAPKSFTGEESVEISCHGSIFIQNKILQLLISIGARLADPGEFTMRAFMHGKMDLSQAEAVADLISAESEAAHKVALQQMRGGFSKEIAALREELINFASLLELELDFAEEDVEFANRENFAELLKKIATTLKTLISSFKLGNVIKNGIPVAIVGAPNAGKSTLLNALLNEERAIVSEIAGTTRDTIEDEIHLGGITFRFIDTAGLRYTTDVVENIGIRKAKEKIEQAHIILYVYDAHAADSKTEQHLAEIAYEAQSKPILALANKIDAGEREIKIPERVKKLCISAKNNQGIEELKNALIELAGVSQLSNNSVVITNARHVEALQKAMQAVGRVEEGLSQNLTTDLLSEETRDALRYLGDITGAIEPDRDILGTIFGKFCIGK